MYFNLIFFIYRDIDNYDDDCDIDDDDDIDFY